MVDYSDKRFLLVDPRPDFRNMLKQLLRDLGAFSIEEAPNSREARHFCQLKKFDVIFAEFDLGDNHDARKLLESLRHAKLIDASSAFVITSSEMAKEQVLSILECEPDSYLIVPFTLATLKKRLDVICARNTALGDLLNLVVSGDYNNAIAYCESYIEKQGPYVHWCEKILAELYVRQGALDQAETLYQRVNQKQLTDWALIGLGKITLSRRDYAQAKKHLCMSVEKFPLALAAYDQLAEAYLGLEDFDAAQRVLQQAVSLCGVSVPRQRSLFSVSWENQDFDTAILAARKTIKLAKNSLYDIADNGLNLARVLADYAAVSDAEKAQELIEEAHKVLEKVINDFNCNQVELQSKLIESRLLCAVRQYDEAQRQLSYAERLYSRCAATVDINIDLEMAQTYLDNRKTVQAVELLEQLLNDNPEDGGLQKQVDRLLPEPRSAQAKQQIHRMINEGATLYKEDKLEEAVAAFAKAHRAFPRHVGITLNLVQSIVSELELGIENDDHTTLCWQSLLSLQCLAPGHVHYDRYITLNKIFTTKYAEAQSS